MADGDRQHVVHNFQTNGTVSGHDRVPRAFRSWRTGEPGIGSGAGWRSRRGFRFALKCCLVGVGVPLNCYFLMGYIQSSNAARQDRRGSDDLPQPVGPVITHGTMGTTHPVRLYGAGASGMNETGTVRSWFNPTVDADSAVIPSPWDSRLCMEHWGRPELQTEPDPQGYVIFVNGAEQLGGNKYLLADGLFVAKMLDRTLVEYPARDARISTANATMGVGAYWDLSAMCMNHRILDLGAFRALVERQLIAADDFVTIDTSKRSTTTAHFTDVTRVQRYYKEHSKHNVIVMEHTWKSSINRHTMDYLHPNPFYLGVVRMLLVGHEDFQNGEFMAVQWRTETATGNMSVCYEEIRKVIEKTRLRLGYTREQVIFNTDMYGSTSGTYKPWTKNKVGTEALRRIREDYPKALDNRLHTFFDQIKDSGVKAIVSGLVMAQSRVLLASSLNDPSLKNNPDACVCQKPFSGYIQLITDWRTQLMRKDPASVVRLFAFGAAEEPSYATSSVSKSSERNAPGEDESLPTRGWRGTRSENRQSMRDRSNLDVPDAGGTRKLRAMRDRQEGF